MSEVTFRGLEIRDLEILGMGSWTEEAGFRASQGWVETGAEGAGTRVCGYAIKNSGLTVV